MPIRYSIDRIHRRLVTHADGVLTFHDINAHLDIEQGNRDLDLPELFDARGATTALTPTQVRRLVQRAEDISVIDVGGTVGVTAASVIDVDVDLGYSPDFFGNGLNSYVLTTMGNLTVGIPFGGTRAPRFRPSCWSST